MSHVPDPVSSHDFQHQLGYLLASIAVLALAPLLGLLGRRSPRITASVDMVMALATVALVGLGVLPECIEVAGSPALLAALAGLLLPALFEHRLRAFTRGLTAWLATLALAVHAMTDGFALAGAHVGHAHSHELELAVILHRLPFAAALWWFLRRRGRVLAVAALALLALGTLVGFGLGVTAVTVTGDHGALFQAFAGGMVMHVLLHRPFRRTVDAILPWALAAFFAFAAVEALVRDDLRALPVALCLVGLAFVFVFPRFDRLCVLPHRHSSEQPRVQAAPVRMDAEAPLQGCGEPKCRGGDTRSVHDSVRCATFGETAS